MVAVQERQDHDPRRVRVVQDWLGTGVYEQTLQVDGFRQQEINVLNPSFPDPGCRRRLTPTNRYLLDDGLRLASSWAVNAGIDQTMTPALRVERNLHAS